MTDDENNMKKHKSRYKERNWVSYQGQTLGGRRGNKPGACLGKQSSKDSDEILKDKMEKHGLYNGSLRSIPNKINDDSPQVLIKD